MLAEIPVDLNLDPDHDIDLDPDHDLDLDLDHDLDNESFPAQGLLSRKLKFVTLTPILTPKSINTLTLIFP